MQVLELAFVRPQWNNNQQPEISSLRPDYYKILAVEPDADDLTLKCAYYKLAGQHHPDRNQGSAEAEHRFRHVTEAYEILSDPKLRAAYDAGNETALEKLIAIPNLSARKSRPAYFRMAPYAVAAVTAYLLWLSLSGLGRYLAAGTGQTAAVASNPTHAVGEPQPMPGAGLKPADRPIATHASAGKRAPKAASGFVTVVRGARPVTQTPIPYPPDALREGVSGFVELQITIGADGSVQNPQVLSGHPLLTRDVAEAISQWTFQSMRVNGRPVPRTTEMTVRFDIVK